MKHKDEIIRLGAEGHSYSEIVKRLGCSKGTVAYHLGEGQVQKKRDRQNEARERIKHFLREYKESRGCGDCKIMYPYYVLQFDHLRDKSFQISSFHKASVALELVASEVEKCEVVCANCHAERTHSRRIASQALK